VVRAAIGELIPVVGAKAACEAPLAVPRASFYRKRGSAPAAIEQRRAVLDAAYAAHPERFVRKPPQPLPAPTEVWINKPQTPENKSQ
jgi:hypothetical protein